MDCTTWIWATETTGQQCRKPAVMHGQTVAFCEAHTDRILESLTFGVLKAARASSVREMMVRLGLVRVETMA